MLIWLALAVAAFYLVKRALRPRVKNGDPPGSASPAELEAMVPCTACGTHVPASEAVVDATSGTAFCCQEHRRSYLDAKR